MDLANWLLSRSGRPGVLAEPVRTAVAWRTGFDQVLTRRRTVETYLDLDGVVVPYGPVGELLGLQAFPLSLDGPDHLAARCLIGRALDASHGAHEDGCSDASALAEKVLRTDRPTIDAMAELVDPCIGRWTETWFGLPGMGPELLTVSRLVTHAMFFNPASPAERTEKGALALAVRSANAVRSTLAPRLRTATAGTLGQTLLAEVDDDADLAARHLLGLTVGPLALGSWAMANALVELLDRPPGLDHIHTTAQAANAFAEALKRRPPLPGVPRRCDRARRILGPDSLVTVPAGDVLASTYVASLRDGLTGPGPAFGVGSHRCMGPAHIAGVAGEVLVALASRRPRLPVDGSREARIGPPPEGIQAWPFPTSLVLELA